MQASFTLFGFLVTLQIINSASQNNFTESYIQDIDNGTIPDSGNFVGSNDSMESSIIVDVVNGPMIIPDIVKSDALNAVTLYSSSSTEHRINETSSAIHDFVRNGDIAAILHLHKHGDINLPTINLPDRQNPEFLQFVKNGDMPHFSDFVKGKEAKQHLKSHGNFPPIPDFVKKSMEGGNFPAIPDFVMKSMKDGNNPVIPDFARRGKSPAIPDFVKNGNTPAIPDFLRPGNAPSIPDFVQKAMKDANIPAVPEFLKNSMKDGNTPVIPEIARRGNTPTIPDFLQKAMNDGNIPVIPDFVNRGNTPAIPDFFSEGGKIPSFSDNINAGGKPPPISEFANVGNMPQMPDYIKEADASDDNETMPEIHDSISSFSGFSTIRKTISSDIIDNDPRIPMSFRRKYLKKKNKDAKKLRDRKTPKTSSVRTKVLTKTPVTDPVIFPETDPVIIPEFMKPFLHNNDSSNPQTSGTIL